MEVERFLVTRVPNTLNTLPECLHSPCTSECPSSREFGVQNSSEIDFETSLIKSIVEDDKDKFISFSRLVFDSSIDRTTVSKFLHLCCTFDAVDCATSLLTGELGVVPLVNEVEAEGGLSPLHAAAKANAARCVEMLLRKHARTDIRSRRGGDGQLRAVLPLELSLSTISLEVTWNPDEDFVEDLVIHLREKDLTAVKLLSEKTKEIDEVAYATAMAGRVVDFAILLAAAAERVNGSVLELHDSDSESKVKTTVYEYLVREALALGRSSMASSPRPASKRNLCALTDSERAGKRKLLLCEIELLQRFGAVVQTNNKKVISPLIRASQVGDEAIIQLLLKSNIDVNDADAEGNTALHWCLKTSKDSCPQQIKIMWLLMKHGAQVNQKNMLGLTAVHIAAANGNSQALQVLLVEDPDCINSKSEMKETPLFFAVKNDHLDCAELLLRWGANTEVFNLRKQRPIDLADSQDMRFMLSRTNICLTNHACPVQQKYTVWLQGDEVISETREELSNISDKSNTPDRTCTSKRTEICKYFDSPSGCVRGAKCFYSHDEMELQQLKQKTDSFNSSAALDLSRKIFVGGLPPSLDSDLLRTYFEEKFGPVDNAVVVGAQIGEKMQSRGFGFVTFKDKKSVAAALAEHYITIMGKQAEIKSAVPKILLLAELQKSPQKHEQQSDRHLLEAEMPREKATKKEIWPALNEKTEMNMLTGEARDEKTGKDFPDREKSKETNPELMSWVNKLMHGQPKSSLDESPCQREKTPAWFIKFRMWFPRLLKEVSKNGGEYALSSLKADFRTTFGQELDHASLGFPKLSDFVKCFSSLCQIKFVQTGTQKPANHMVLVPSPEKPLRQHIQSLLSGDTLPLAKSTDDNTENDYNDDKPPQDLPPVYDKSDVLTGDRFMVLHHDIPDDNLDGDTCSVFSKFLQFLKPDPIFHARPWLHSGCHGCAGDYGRGWLDGAQGMKPIPPERHVVLESLSRENNNSSVFFLREFDFYNNYRACIRQGKCFGCNLHPALWINFPCQHLLWCADCKLKATRAAVNSEHRCVVCDARVLTLYLTSLHQFCEPIWRQSSC